MEVWLDGAVLDLSLEEERYLSEVLSGLEEWLRARGLGLEKVLCDGAEVILPVDGGSDRELGEVSRLDLFSCPDEGSADREGTLRDQVFETLRSFFEVALEALAEKRGEFLENLFSDSEQLIKLTKQHLGSRHFGVLERLELELRELEYFQNDFSCYTPAQIDSFSALLNRLTALFVKENAVSEEKKTVLVDWQQEAEELNSILKDLEEAPVILQRGGVAGILREVNRLGEFLEKLLEKSEVLGRSEISSFFQLLQPHLEELIRAISEEDIITIGDLLEYEIVPVLKDLNAALA